MHRFVRPPAVSVVMTVYNQAEYLAEAIQSIRDQTFGDWELIVVDDGSSDEPRSVVERFGSTIRFIRQDNAGLGAARDAGVDAAEGDLIAFCDADDIHLPYRLAAHAALLQQAPEAALVFSELSPYRDGEVIAETLLRDKKLGPMTRPFQIEVEDAFGSWWTCRDRDVPVPGSLLHHRVYQGRVAPLIAGAHIAWGGASMFRRAALRAVGGHSHTLRRYADWHLVSRLSKAYELIFCDVPVLWYRLHATQLTKMSTLGSRCYRDIIEDVWRSDPVFYAQHKAVVDRSLGAAYWQLGTAAAGEGDWAGAQESFRASIQANPRQRRAYADLARASVMSRVKRP